MTKPIKAVDLFCGAGGTSLGLTLASKEAGLKLNLVAINHWPTAIETHSANHPQVEHFCTNLDSVDPRQLVPGGKLDLLVASPECIHHSIARGGKPINDQSRASAWRVIEWASQLQVKNILIENVKEFRTWGGLGVNGRPLKRRKGETYLAFLAALRSLGYTVEDRVLNAADFGDPTSRERLFIQARLGRKPIVWPEPTHAPAAKPKSQTVSNGQLFDISHNRKPYRTAREIIDWSLPSESIFTRKRPLKPNTLNRIFRGLEKFAGILFIVPQEGDDRVRSIDRPLQVIKTQSRGIGLVEPFLVKYFGGADGQSVDQPLPTTTANYEHYGLCQPFIVLLRNNQSAQSIDRPLTTLTTKGAHHGLCQPYVVVLRNNADAQSLDDPLRTLTTGGNFGLAQPFLVQMDHSKSEIPGRDIDRPMPTITSADAMGVAQPFIVPFFGERDGQQPRPHSVDQPLESFLVKYNGTGGAMALEEPLDTVTAKDRFGLVQMLIRQGYEVGLLDIHFRMLQPHELAAAMSFPKTYFFAGNREQKVRQIGNAVAVQTAKALCLSILTA